MSGSTSNGSHRSFFRVTRKSPVQKTIAVSRTVKPINARIIKSKVVVNSRMIQEGKEYFEGLRTRRKARNQQIQSQTKVERTRILQELAALQKRIRIHIVPKGTVYLATLRAHGYKLSLEEHIHLSKHIMDEPTKRIIAKLDQQVAQKEMDACSECALDNYFEMV